MGNAIGGKRKGAKIMKIDGSTFKIKLPAKAADVLRQNKGYTLLEADDVKRRGLRAEPLDDDAPLERGKLYFLVELPKFPNGPAPRRAWSGQLVGGAGGARERLERLMLTRRSVSDLSSGAGAGGGAASAESPADGVVRLKMRLPKSEVEKVMMESVDANEATKKIVELFTAKDVGSRPRTPPMSLPPVKEGRVEKRARFVALPAEIIA